VNRAWPAELHRLETCTIADIVLAGWLLAITLDERHSIEDGLYLETEAIDWNPKF
jgi:hypothetical protein